MNWPEWWNWDLEITPHAEKRMVQRSFTEIELRQMFVNATNFKPYKKQSRYVIRSSLRSTIWEIIVEPDFEQKLLVVITAYRIEE